MKNLKRTLREGAIVAGLMIAGAASANTIVDIFQPADPVAIAVGTQYSYSFTHDFTDNGYVPGYDTITAAGLLIILTDAKGNEDYTISFGIAPQTTSYTTNIAGPTNFPFSVLAPSLTDLSNTGKLGVTITADSCTGNDCASNAFQFVSSTLTAQDPPSSVPEPSSLLLLGLGLVGLGAIRGRMRSL